MNCSFFDLANKGTWEWWSEIIIPALGVVFIPLLIWGLTWIYGAKRAEKLKQKQENKASINCLKSTCYYTVINLLTLYQAIDIRLNICKNYATADDKDKCILFSQIVFEDVYNQIEVEKYGNLTITSPTLIVNILQVKRSLVDIFKTISLLNDAYKNFKDVNSIPFYIIALGQNLPCTKEKIVWAIDKLIVLIDDIELVVKKLNLSDIVQINFSKEEEELIKKTQEDLKNFLNNENCGSRDY